MQDLYSSVAMNISHMCISFQDTIFVIESESSFNGSILIMKSSNQLSFVSAMEYYWSSHDFLETFCPVSSLAESYIRLENQWVTFLFLNQTKKCLVGTICSMLPQYA